MRRQDRSFPLYMLPLVMALLPVIGINASYLIAASVGHVPWCIPYVEGCTSISAVGRQPPEAFVFRATTIPLATLFMLFWPLAARWLAQMGDAARKTHAVIIVLGVTAGVFLIVYATVLGEVGPHYRLQRQLGATTYFAFTFLAQLMLTRQVVALRRNDGSTPASRYAWGLLAPCLLMFGVGLLSVILQLVWDGYDLAEDTVEWVFAILMFLWFVPVFFAWRRCGFSLRLGAVADKP